MSKQNDEDDEIKSWNRAAVRFQDIRLEMSAGGATRRRRRVAASVQGKQVTSIKRSGVDAWPTADYNIVGRCRRWMSGATADNTASYCTPVIRHIDRAEPPPPPLFTTAAAAAAAAVADAITPHGHECSWQWHQNSPLTSISQARGGDLKLWTYIIIVFSLRIKQHVHAVKIYTWKST